MRFPFRSTGHVSGPAPIRRSQGAAFLVTGLILALGACTPEDGPSPTAAVGSSSPVAEEREIVRRVHDEIFRGWQDYVFWSNAGGASLSACIDWAPRDGVLYETHGLYAVYASRANDVAMFPSEMRRDSLANCRASREASQGTCRCYETDLSGQNVLRLDAAARSRLAAAGPGVAQGSGGRARTENSVANASSPEYDRIRDLYDADALPEALERVEQLLRDDPDAVAALLWRAILRRDLADGNQKKLRLALLDHNRVLELETESGVAWFQRGRTHFSLDQYEQAVADFTRAIQLDSEYFWPRYLRGRSKFELGDNEGAVSDLTAAIALRRDYRSAFNWRGRAYDNMRKFELAIEDFSEAIRLDPEYDAAWHNRGMAYSELHEDRRAIEDYDRAVAIDPDDPLTLRMRARSRAYIGDFDGALRDVDKAIRLDPNETSHHHWRGNILRMMGDPERAIASYDRAIAIDPENNGSYGNRGIAHAEAGDFVAALADTTHAIEIAPNQAGRYHNHGEVLSRAGRHQEAYGAMLEAEKGASPGTTWWLIGKAHGLAGIGRRDEALPLFKRGLQTEREETIRRFEATLMEQGFYSGPVRGSYSEALGDAVAACLSAGCSLPY